MKNIKTKINSILHLIIVTVVIASCTKDQNFAPYETQVSSETAKLKFIHTAVGPMGTNFTINLFLNDVKTSAVGVTAGLPTGFGYGSAFPAPINYAAIPSGTQPLKVVIPARAAIASTTANPAGVPAFPDTTVLTEPFITVAGKKYSTFLTGISPNYSLFTIPDDLPATNINEPTFAYIRFINLITNTPTTGYDLAIVRTTPATSTTPAITTTVKTFTNVAYRGGNVAFETLVTIPTLQSTPDQLQLRLAGTTTVVASLATGFIPRPGRVYTLFARGFVGGLPNVTTNIPALSFYTNQ